MVLAGEAAAAAQAARGGGGDASPPSSPRLRQTTFGATLDFIEALCDASSGLTSFAPVGALFDSSQRVLVCLACNPLLMSGRCACKMPPRTLQQPVEEQCKRSFVYWDGFVGAS